MSMKPITLANLGYAFGKLKEFFVQIKDAVLSVNGNTPDELGDVQIRRVDYAGDIESTSTQISTGDFIQRTSGGTASIESGDSWLAQVYGNSVHTGYIPESIEMTVTPISQETPITAEINEDTFRSKMSASGTVTFTYTTDWSINPATYGITVTGTPSAGDQIVVVYVMEDRGTITNAEPETFVSTGWNLYSHTLGYAKVVRYSDTNGYRIDGEYSALAFATTPTGTQQSVSVTDHVFNPPADGYIIVTGGNSTDTSITPTWDDWIDEANNGEWEGYEANTIDLSSLFGEGNIFPKGLCKVGSARDEINISLAQAISRIEVIEYSAAALAEARASGRDYDVDEDTIYLVRATPETTTIAISGAHECADHGIEYFTGTEIEVGASIIYGTNLRNKLERDVLTISAQTLTEPQQRQVLTNLGILQGRLDYVEMAGGATADISVPAGKRCVVYLFGGANGNQGIVIASANSAGTFRYVAKFGADSITTATTAFSGGIRLTNTSSYYCYAYIQYMN